MSSLGAFKSALEGLIWVANKSKPSHKLHDPLTTLIRFALLPLKPEGTKLNILNHKITYRPPHAQQAYLIHYPAQDEYRWSQEEFCLLSEPIEKAVHWFAKEPLAKKIFEMAITGLKIMQKAYEKKSKEAHLALTQFLHTIEKGLSSKSYAHDHKGAETMEGFLQRLWTVEEVYAIYRLLVIAESRYSLIKKEKKRAKELSSSLRSTLSAIEVILQDKDERLLRFVSRKTV